MSGVGLPPYNLLVVPVHDDPGSNGSKASNVISRNFSGDPGVNMTVFVPYPSGSQYIVAVSLLNSLPPCAHKIKLRFDR